MQAIKLIKTGNPETAFKKVKINSPVPNETQVLIAVEAFGLNFADVMARLGQYPDAPPKPAILGYDVVGKVIQCGNKVPNDLKGKRVVALTRFGGYAEQAVAEHFACAEVGANMPAASALALATQYTTAWYASMVLTRLLPQEKVLIHAAAGGVGQALVNIAKMADCTIFATAGSAEKEQLLKTLGIDYFINYRAEKWRKRVAEILKGEKLHVIFDALGGKNSRKAISFLSPGGRWIGYGAATRSGKTGFFNDLRFAIGFGLFSPIQLLMHSRSMLTVNMLHIADKHPQALQQTFKELMAAINSKKLNLPNGTLYPIDKFNQAHLDLGNRQTTGKIGIAWNGS